MVRSKEVYPFLAGGYNYLEMVYLGEGGGGGGAIWEILFSQNRTKRVLCFVFVFCRCKAAPRTNALLHTVLFVGLAI